jgi:tetratricopeptide (TPR) repeat protein
LTDEAKRALEAAAERSPADPDVALTMADWLLDREGNGKDADAWYARALANAVDGAAVTARVAAARLRMGRADEADELAEKALTLDGRCAEALSVRSGVLTSRGRLDEALAVRRQALQIDPENAAAHLDAADLLARLGREDDARIEIQVASGLDPRGALLLDYVEGLLTRENAIFAESFLADLVKVGYGGARGRFVHAHVLAAVGRGDEARSHLAAALEAAERSALDSRLLRESRRRLPDREFARLAGGA